ncbi:MAG: hypothetical protein JWO35_535 [Candidatus Saccharibacteria bacterium]|nr:hypothetical protein [Candidatus Saccharibacteria bacterium]
MPEGETPEPSNEDVSRADVYITAKMMSGMSAGLAFIANVESIAGWDAVSTNTLRVAGAVAVGAACGAVAGFFSEDCDS